MSDLQFNDQTDEFGRPPVASLGSDLTGKLVQWGLASTRQQAEYLMMGIAAVIVVIAFFLYMSGGDEPAAAAKYLNPGAVEVY